MNKTIYIRDNTGYLHYYKINFCTSNFKKIEVENVCIIYLSKYHNHRYDLKCFFYETKYIYYEECIYTLKELHNVIQKLLYENLNSAMQK